MNESQKDNNKWTACGLNADWCVQAWHYGTNEPNRVDGDLYVCDDEDGTFSVNQYFPSREEDCTVTLKTFSSKLDAMNYVETNNQKRSALRLAKNQKGKTNNEH